MMRVLTKIFLVVILISFSGCEKDENLSLNQDSIYGFIDAVMDEWYFWNQTLPDVNIDDYSKPQDLVDALTVEKDKWSFVDKTEQVNAIFKEGEDFGFGFFIAWDEPEQSENTTMRVRFIYEDTKGYEEGIRRGWTLLEIDGLSVNEINDFSSFFSSDPATMLLKFRTDKGSEKEITLSKETFKMNGILHSSIYEVNAKKVGYMVYQSFLGYSEDDLDSTFDALKAEELDELVIDLRYNQGGYITLAHKMVNTLVPQSSDGDVFFDMKHNSKRSERYDTTYRFEVADNNLDLSRVFFITNEYSASASELVINGLQPHMEVFTIGQNTYGKPVAMYGFEHEDWLFYPVTAKSVNANGIGDYFDGIEANKEIFDNHHNEWGDLNDPSLNQAFHYITYGSFDSSVSVAFKSSSYKDNTLMPERFKRNLLLLDK